MTVDELRALFQANYGAPPEVIASAPGRVNIIGEHTDYNGGEVLPIAIDRRTLVAVRKSGDARKSRASSTTESPSGEFNARAPRRDGAWWDYVSGVCAKLGADKVDVPQFDAVVASDVPSGAGLSSSAALEVATSVALTALARGTDRGALPLKELALVSWRAETQFVGVNCGVMDQFASALCEPSNALHLWCDTLRAESVPMKEHVLIFDTGTARSLRGSEYNARRAECEQALALLQAQFPDLPNLAAAKEAQIEAVRLPSVLKRRALHVAQENARVGVVVSALKSTGSIPGATLYESHESLRGQYECSTPELDWFVDQMLRSPGISGARLTGAGWGGCAIAVGSREALSAVEEEVGARYEKKFGRAPRIWLTSAAAGAKVEAVFLH